MRTLFAVAVFVFVSSLKLAGQIAPPPTPRVTAAPQGTGARGPSRGAVPQGPAARGAVTQGTGVYLVTFRPGTPAAERDAIVRATGARLRAAYNATNMASVDLPDASALARLRNDPRVLDVFESQKIYLNVQGRGGAGGGSKPKPPESLAATAPSASQINLSWIDVSNNEDGLAIERCAGSGCANFAEIFRAGANVTTYADSGLAAQTEYRYRVMAFNSAGSSKYSNTAQATTLTVPPPPPPATPGNLSATPITFSSITLSWSDNSNNENGFAIERCAGMGCANFSEIFRVGANTTTYADSGLTAQTVYRYRVMAFNVAGNSPYSNIAEATTPPTPPAAPGNLSATAVTFSSITLSWSDNSNNENGFAIERCSGSGCSNFSEIFRVGANTTTYADSGLTAQTAYRYRVMAFNVAGNSPYSNIAEATTPSVPPTPPAAPGNLSATAVTFSDVTLSWSDNSNNENGFAIERCSGSGCSNFSEIFRVGANTTTYADSGLTAQTAYRYRVMAFNVAGNSPYSNIAEATTPAAPPPPPAAPGNLSATPITFSSITLSWSDNSSDETGFAIERCAGITCANFSEIFRVGANTTTYADSGLTAQTVYRYRVLAFSAAGNSPYSNVAEATTPAAPPPPPAAPGNLSATPITLSSITLSWSDNSSDETGFAIERCAGSACANFSEILRVGANTTTYADSGLAAQTVYRYRVLAFNVGGNSPYSNIAEATTPPPPPPSAPSGLTATAISYNHVELSWSDNSSDEEGFRIERCAGTLATCVSFAQIAQVTADINTLSDLGGQGQTTYTYRVRAFNTYGQSAYSSPAQVTTPAAPASTQVVPAGVKRIGAAPGRLNWTGAGVGVAVVDTGLDFNHADLGLQPEIPGVNSFNATAMGTTCQDIHGHGTHVAGIIGAKNNLIDVVGVAPNATIYCVNVFQPDPDSGVSATDESVIAGLDWILAHANTLNPKIRVVNMSLGREKTIGDDNPNHPLRVAVRALYNAGISVVVAAGNDATIEVMNEVPAFYPEVMAVASTTADNGVNGYTEEFPACTGFQAIKADTASYFTTDGAFISGTGVTISAPGETQEDLFDFGGSCFVEPIGILSLQAGGGTVELSGTSMAAPHVAGVVALMWEKEMTLGLSLSPNYARIRIRDNSIRRGTAPLDSLLDEYTFDGEREGVIWAPSALLDEPAPPQDAPPTVTIVTPANGATFNTGASIAFSGTATDPEDGNIAAALGWASDRDGHIGNGASFTRTLTNGNHVITASLVDSGGNTAKASVSISVGSTSTPTTVRAGSVTYSLVGTTLHYTVKLVNEFGGPVAGASIRVSLYEWVFTGNLWFSNGTTDSQGNAHFQLLNTDFGCYTTGVENVVAPGLTWVPGTPSNSYCRL